MPDITIFIRARNEAQRIGQCLQMIYSQQTALSYEVAVLDCQSEDETVEIAKKFAVAVYSIPRAIFTYSAALNFGAQQAKGALFVSVSAHAVPCDEKWLDQLVAPLRNSQSIGASFSRQLPFLEACRAEAAAIMNSFPDASWVLREEDLRGLSSEERYKKIVFSNVSSCIRTDIVRTLPFREIPFSEDRLFACECLRAGHGVAYTAESRIYHLHEPSMRENVSIAKRAMIARSAIIHFIKQSENGPPMVCVKPEGAALLCKSLCKLCLFPVWFMGALLQMALTKGGFSKRAFLYQWSQLGIVGGKLQAAAFLLRNRTCTLEIARPDRIAAGVRQLM